MCIRDRDGFEVARRLRAMPALAGAFLVAMSGYGSDEDRAEALSAGFDEYLVKPVDLGLLRDRLQSRVSGASREPRGPTETSQGRYPNFRP